MAHDPIHAPAFVSEPSSDTLKPVILIAESCQSGADRNSHSGNAGQDVDQAANVTACSAMSPSSCGTSSPSS